VAYRLARERGAARSEAKESVGSTP
jgi:hypothetical protein